jgi:hypothetical protein
LTLARAVRRREFTTVNTPYAIASENQPNTA